MLCLLIQEWLFWRKTFQWLLPFDPYCFCVVRHITTIALFIMIFRSEIFYLDIFCSLLLNISGLVCQNVLLLFILVATFVSISTDNTIQLRHLHLKEVLYNFLMILPSINQINEYKLFYLSYLYGGISRRFFTFSLFLNAVR